METTKKLSASQKYRQLILSMAENRFDNHVCTQTLDAGEWKAWRCQAPGTWNYGFNVMLKPGWLILDGDIGFVAFSRTKDMLSWIRGAINDPDYIAEKVPQEIKVREYNEQIAEESILEAQEFALQNNLMPEKGYEDILEFFEDCCESAREGEQGYYEAVARMIDEDVLDDPSQCHDLTPGFLYQWTALKWWLAAIGG